MKERKTLQAVIVCSFIIASLQLQAKKPDFPDEVLSAKTIAIRVNFVGEGTVTDKKSKRWGPLPHHYASADELKTYMQYTRSEVEEIFNRKKRFQVVSDPAQADLICVVILYEPFMFEGKVNGSAAEVVMIVKGGTNPQWEAAPIWVEGEVGNYGNWRRHLDQVARFHDHLYDAEKKKNKTN